MCELLALKSPHEFALEEVLEHAKLLEEYGLAGYGWGVSWVGENGIENYRSLQKLPTLTIEDLPIANVKTTACVVHLRRPSHLSSIALENTQPFVENGSFAFAHNGFLAKAADYQASVASELTGGIDSEIGFRRFVAHLKEHSPDVALTTTVEETLGDGDANVIVLWSDGRMQATGRNQKNRLFHFHAGDKEGFVTEVHSPDGFLFESLYPWMKEPRQITTVEGI